MDEYTQSWRSKTFNNMQSPEREAAIWNIVRTEDVLQNIYVGCAERIVKALFLVNAGGVVALLAFLHNGLESKKIIWIIVSLGVFLIGLVFAFILVGIDFLMIEKKFQNFKKDQINFFNNNISFEEINYFRSDKINLLEKNIYQFGVRGAGMASFICAVAGVFIGMYGYFFK